MAPSVQAASDNERTLRGGDGYKSARRVPANNSRAQEKIGSTEPSHMGSGRSERS
jgi:hypothetical protein